MPGVVPIELECNGKSRDFLFFFASLSTLAAGFFYLDHCRCCAWNWKDPFHPRFHGCHLPELEVHLDPSSKQTCSQSCPRKYDKRYHELSTTSLKAIKAKQLSPPEQATAWNWMHANIAEHANIIPVCNHGAFLTNTMILCNFILGNILSKPFLVGPRKIPRGHSFPTLQIFTTGLVWVVRPGLKC